MIGKTHNMDNIQGLTLLEDGSIDLIVTSPPYDNLRDYKGYSFDFENLAKVMYSKLKQGGTIAWIVGDSTNKGNKSLTSFKQALYFQKIGFNVFDVMIYEKDVSSPPHPNRYNNMFEYILILTKGKIETINIIKDKRNKNFNSKVTRSIRNKDGTLSSRKTQVIAEFGNRGNIWRYNVGFRKSAKDLIAYKHPAIFPEKLANDLIYSFSNKGDLVVDVFSGSGTTHLECLKLERKYLGFEIAEEYIEIEKERIENWVSKE